MTRLPGTSRTGDPRIQKQNHFFRQKVKEIFLCQCADSLKINWENMPKFDVVVGNPPYKQGLHMKFLDIAISISKKNVVFIQPATWILNEKPTNRPKIEYKIKCKINEYETKIYLHNGLNLFKVGIATYVSIIYINKLTDNTDNTNNIIVYDKLYDKVSIYNDINNVSKYGNSKIYLNLKNKLINYSDNLLNHVKNGTGKYFVNLAEIRGHISSECNKMFEDDFYTFIPKEKEIDTMPTHAIYFSFNNKSNAKNFINYLKTNFARFALSIYKINTNSNRGEMNLVPWLDFSQEWTDEKLYKYFDLTQEEIEFIEENIPNYYND